MGKLRNELGVSVAQHRKLLTSLSEEERDLLSPERALRVEQRLQLTTYNAALSTALLAKLPASEIQMLRQEYGVSQTDHNSLLKELQGRSELNEERIERQFEAVADIRRRMSELAALPAVDGTGEFAIFVLAGAQARAVGRIIHLLAVVEQNDRIGELCEAIPSENEQKRTALFEELKTLSDHESCLRLGPILQEWIPAKPATLPADPFSIIRQMANDTDPYQRAAAMSIIGRLADPSLEKNLIDGVGDKSALVRESAVYAAAAFPGILDPAMLAALEEDPVPAVRRSALSLRENDSPRVDAALGAAISPETPLPNVEETPFGRLSTINRMRYLRGVPLFAELEPEDLHELSELATEKKVTAPDPFVVEGEPADVLYVLTHGRAVVTIESQGRPEIVTTLEAGAVLGELSAIDGSPRSATVRPDVGEVRLLQLTGEEFQRLLARRPEIAQMVMTILSRRLRLLLRDYADSAAR